MWNYNIISKYPKEKEMFDFLNSLFKLYIKDLEGNKSLTKKDIENKLKSTYSDSIPIKIDKNYKNKVNKLDQKYKDILMTPNGTYSTNKKNHLILLNMVLYQVLKNEKQIICSACNINYIFLGTGNSNKSRSSEKDHFYPKDLYSYHSFNPYNLTPLCKDCNGDKSTKVKYLTSLEGKYPFDFGSLIKFNFLTSINKFISVNNKQFNHLFSLEERYNDDCLQDIMFNEYNNFLNKKFIEENIKRNGDIHLEIIDKKYTYKNKFNIEPLSKIKYDFYNLIERIEKNKT